ncbi:uncharacterized protein [Mytilus edulis]|uniref:uncharacterized protein n=1 Tax=Mytilus edulis TaxID=6550 RepID=UPI0039EF7872
MLTKKRRNEIYKYLEKLYYNLSNAGAYSGPTKLHQIIKSRGIHDIGIYTIRKWLQNQDNYSLQKPTSKSFKKARVIVNKIDEQFDMDLMDVNSISKSNKDIKFLLVLIDIFSRFLWIEPLKNKTGKEVVAGLKRIFHKGRKCRKLRSDKGTEFVNHIVKSYLKKENIYFFTTQNSQTKANYCERVIKTIKNKMYRIFTKNRNHRYVDILEDIVKNYNKTPHKSLNNIAPQDVNKNNETDLWAYMYLKPRKTTGVTPYKFKINDMMRITHGNMIFKRSYDEQFTREIFKVNKRFRMQNIPQYRIIDLLNQEIRGNMYESEMQKIDKNEDALWFIEKKIRKRKRNGEIQYLVKFDGFDSRFNQWISEKDIIDTTEDSEET